MDRIAIVTDSSSELAPEELDRLGVFCVDLKVSTADGVAFPDGNSPENVEAYFDHLEICRDLPRTSMPSPLAFTQLFERLAKEGYTKALCAHMPEAMSGTVGAARMAAESAPLEVEVVDTHRNTWALGLIVERLAAMRAAGAPFEKLVDFAQTAYQYCNIDFTLDTLKNLVKGGRMGRAAGFAATVLDIKPVLTVGDDGSVSVIGKTRSMKRALAKLADTAQDLVDKLGPLEGYYVHVRNPQAADALRQLFEERGVAFRELGVRQTGPIISTHVGLGTVGFAFIPVGDCQ